MLLGAFDLLLDDPLTFLAILPVILLTAGLALVIGITIHEFSHALAAYRLGDSTAKRAGRLSLNPIRHLDPVGTALLLLVGFGWGKPTPVDPGSLRRGRTGMALVAAAGPVSNVLLASLVAVPIRLGVLEWAPPLGFQPILDADPVGMVALLLEFLILYNIILAVFNLIPLFPLDGSKIALGVLPLELAVPFARLERYGPALLLVIIALDYLTGIGILWKVMGPVVNFLSLSMLGRSIV